MRIQLIVVALTSAMVAMVAWAGSAGAHARLTESTPGVGEVLAASPASVTITFSNDIQKIAGTHGIEVTSEDGTSWTAGPSAVNDEDRTVLAVPLQPNLPSGRYVVMYKNVSDADGDPFEAGFAFYVGVEPTEEQLAEDALLEPPEISATQTFVAGNPASPAASLETQTPAVNVSTPVPQPTTSAPSGGGDGGGGVSPTVIFVIAVGAAIAVIGGAVYATTRNSRG